jgi:fructosamine-3-kinase
LGADVCGESLPFDAAALLGGALVGAEPLAGGYIGDVCRLSTRDRTFVLKQAKACSPPDLMDREAEGLMALGRFLPTPGIIAHGPQWLLLEDWGKQALAGEVALDDENPAWEIFGREFARMHARGESETFGWLRPTYWGNVRHANTPTTDGIRFFQEQRFGRLLHDPIFVKNCPASLRRRWLKIVENLSKYMPVSPAVLSHGDLWSGNRLVRQDGVLGVIDPFVHYGWAEADLGQASVYGGFPARFFAAYEEANKLPDGWIERRPLFHALHNCIMLVVEAEMDDAIVALDADASRLE